MKIKSIILCASALLLISALVGCGQRGPLYMPGEKPTKKSGTANKQKTPTLPRAKENLTTPASQPDGASAP